MLMSWLDAPSVWHSLNPVKIEAQPVIYADIEMKLIILPQR
jgi:hypothetical protein